MKTNNNWILVHLLKHWKMQAKRLNFDSFCATYVKQMILSNKKVGKLFWHYVGLDTKNDFMNLYLYCRDKE